MLKFFVDLELYENSLSVHLQRFLHHVFWTVSQPVKGCENMSKVVRKTVFVFSIHGLMHSLISTLLIALWRSNGYIFTVLHLIMVYAPINTHWVR